MSSYADTRTYAPSSTQSLPPVNLRFSARLAVSAALTEVMAEQKVEVALA